MAKERMINTRIWSDNWVSELDPIEKLLFLYFLTNSYTNISGIYELPMKVAAVETGIDPSMFGKILPRLEPKVIYRDGWVIMPNFPRYQNLKSKDVVLGIQREFDSVPERIQKEAIGGGWGEGLGMVSDTQPNLTKPNSISANAEEQEIKEVRIGEDEAPKKGFSPAKYPNAKTVFRLWGKYPPIWEKNASIRASAQWLFEEKGMEELTELFEWYEKHKTDQFCPKFHDPISLVEKYPKLEDHVARTS